MLFVAFNLQAPFASRAWRGSRLCLLYRCCWVTHHRSNHRERRRALRCCCWSVVCRSGCSDMCMAVAWCSRRCHSLPTSARQRKAILHYCCCHPLRRRWCSTWWLRLVLCSPPLGSWLEPLFCCGCHHHAAGCYRLDTATVVLLVLRRGEIDLGRLSRWRKQHYRHHSFFANTRACVEVAMSTV